VKEKWWTVTAYYPLTYIGIGVVAETAERAEEHALEVMAEEWGARKIYQYEDIEVKEQD
jgi:hypothetical protein